MRRVVPAVLAVALAASAAAVVGVPVAAHATAPVRCTDIGLIGGSISAGSERMQGQEFIELGMTQFRIDAKVGRTIFAKSAGGITTLKKFRAQGYNPDCLILALGTNDIPYYNDPKIYRKFIDGMMDEVNKVAEPPRVLWINVYRGKSRNRDINFNTQLLDAATNPDTTAGTYYPNLQVSDWSTLADAHKDWLSKDGVHPVGKGIRLRAQWVAQEVFTKLNGGGTPDPIPAATCSVSVTLLKYGNTNGDVLCLERRLAQLWFFSSTPNTKYDTRTQMAVASWQGRHGLPVTGRADEATLTGLGLIVAVG